MTDPLSLERFRDLADAYGGVIARWPEQHRAAAMQMARTPNAAEILAQASMLDETLDAWRVSPPTPELECRLSASAPVPGRRFATRARLWWSGIGVAAALSGAVAGAAAVAVLAPIELPSDSGTSFGDVAAQES
jgi:hypothetical protein